jgi:elongation factor Ts
MKENITSQMIKELRERTGVGMSKCKDALVRAEGSIDKAIEILRKEGMASAVKKEGREVKEGFIRAFETDEAISLVEINSETDFVAQNEKFKIFLSDIAKQIAISKISSKEELLKSKFISDEAITVDEYRNLLVQKFGENIQIKKLEIIEKCENCSYGIYTHMLGKIVTVVEVEGSQESQGLAKEISMHVAAESPDYLKPEDVDKDVLEKEKEIARSQIKGKKEEIVEKIVEGKMRSFFEKSCLLNQKYVKDPSITVEKFLKIEGDKENKTLSIKRFWYWKVGQ